MKDQEKNENIDEKGTRLVKKENVFMKKIKRTDKIILSENFSKNLIKNVDRKMGHMGVNQMISMLSPHYTSKNFVNNMRLICKCIRNKTSIRRNYGLLLHLGPAYKPFEIVSIDTIKGFGGNQTTKKLMHLLVDHFSRYAFILTSLSQVGQDFTKLTKEVLKLGKIQKILADQYSGINSKEFKEFLDERNIGLIFTAVNAPFSNGLNERLNQTLVKKIRCEINQSEKKVAWTTVAPKCVKDYNKTVHTVTQFCPEYLLKGINTLLVPEELRCEKTNNLEEDRLLAVNNSIRYHNYNKRRYDEQRQEHNFEAGDLVYVENSNRLNRRKLDEVRLGPYKIEKKTTIFKIETGHRKKESNLFHTSKLIPFQN